MKKLKLFTVTFLTILGLNLISAVTSYATIGSGTQILNDTVLKSAIKNALRTPNSAKKSNTGSKGTTKFKSTNNTRGLDEIVSSYPANIRNEVRAQFQDIYDTFPKFAEALDIPTDDLASGFAILLVGVYVSYNNGDLDHAYVKPLTDQLRTALIDTGSMLNMSDSEKQYLYDQMVMIGLTMGISQLELQKNPNAKMGEKLRNSGKEILEKIFNISASRIKITEKGLVIN